MILIAQQTSGSQYAGVVARLVEADQKVVVANSKAEAFGLMPDLKPTVVLLEDPEVHRCPHVLCGWIRAATTPVPKLVGIVRIDDPDQRARCGECMTVLGPDTHASLVAGTVMALAADPA